MTDHYKTLGISRRAKPEEIKAAYRFLAKRFHPDLNPGNLRAEERFKEISVAYETLSDPLERKRYDFKLMYGGTLNYPPGAGSPQGAAREKEDPAREEAKRKAYTRHKEKKKQEAALYKRRAVFISICVVLVIVFGLNAPNEKTEREEMMQRFLDKNHKAYLQSEPEEKVVREIQTADSPYDSLFGGSRYDDFSDNSLLIGNKLQKDVIVSLVEYGKQGKTIRNKFIRSGDMYNIVHLPDGKYNLLVFAGKRWNPAAEIPGLGAKGTFTADTAFYRAGSGPIIMKKTVEKGLSHFSSYGIVLNDSVLAGYIRIPAARFFK